MRLGWELGENDHPLCLTLNFLHLSHSCQARLSWEMQRACRPAWVWQSWDLARSPRFSDCCAVWPAHTVMPLFLAKGNIKVEAEVEGDQTGGFSRFPCLRISSSLGMSLPVSLSPMTDSRKGSISTWLVSLFPLVPLASPKSLQHHCYMWLCAEGESKRKGKSETCNLVIDTKKKFNKRMNRKIKKCIHTYIWCQD